MKHNKRGSAVVEASMVFPIVIAAVIAVIYIVICLYSSLSFQTGMQLSVRQESGKQSETVFRADSFQKMPVKESRIGISRILYAEGKNNYKMKGMISATVSRTDYCRVYIIDETEVVRKVYFADEILQ